MTEKYKQISFDNVEALIAKESNIEVSALNRFSLRGKRAEIEKRTVASVPLLDNLVYQGNFCVVYAQPNTGKTLITLSLIINAIENGKVKPSNIYYLNLDDTGSGLLTKLNFAEEYGFHMLAEGEAGFRAIMFQEIIKEMLRNDQCLGRVIILDTLKKIIDVMDKAKVRDFTSLIRSFVQKGGTLVALAHTNKRSDSNGKIVYGGVSDVLDDCDCAYIAATAEHPEAGYKMVVFENIKRRGDVDLKAAFQYSCQSGISYDELVTSVEKVRSEQLDQFVVQAAQKTDAEVITAISECIKNGINTKMKLVKAVTQAAGISKRAAIKVIEKYTGTEADKHFWHFKMRGHGAQEFELI